MKQFFSTLFASILGLCIGVCILFGILAGVVAGLSEKGGPKEIKENSVLHVQLNDQVVDRASNSPLDNIELPGISSDKKVGLSTILEALERAKTNDNIKGIYLDITDVAAGLGTLTEIRNALIDFKESGKWIVSYSEYYTQKAYYLASVADELYLYPEGEVDFKGLRTELMFFKNALDKLDVEVQIIRGRNNKFKSAVEPFMYDHMSDANREQVEKYLGSMWNEMLTGISESRNVSIEELNTMADSLSIQGGESAVGYKLIDKTMYKDELLALLRAKLEIDEDDDINTASFAEVAAKTKEEKAEKELEDKKEKVAVIYATGSIESGNGDDETIGSERISKAIREARLDSTVKAIVLRVNSPGGSALASDVMWRETILAKEAKPFVVSMGDVAASGGYYISCAADKIFANPTTVTGSIGVFGMMPNAKNVLENKMGINVDRVTTNAHSDLGTIFRGLDDYEGATIQLGVEKIYSQFTQKVAEGRGMTQEAVDAIGQGRVWSGVDAKEIGLVDEFGGLDEAVAYAAELAELEDYDLQSLPKQKDPMEEIMKELKGEANTFFMESALGDNYKYFQQIETVKDLKGIQMRMPFIIDIQ